MMNYLKTLAASLCLLASSTLADAETTEFKTENMVAFIQLSPVGAFYGSPVTREIARKGEYSGVIAIYLKGSDEFTATGLGSRMEDVARRLIIAQPKYILVEESLMLMLEQHLPSSLKNRVRTYQFADMETQYAKSYAMQLKDFFGRSNYNLYKVVIMHDSSPRSMAKAMLSQDKLIKAGFGKSQVQLKLIKTFQGIRTFLSETASWPKSLLINNVAFLRDAELGEPRFGDDIKAELDRLNRWHIDVGFWRSQHDEAIVFTPNVNRIVDSMLYQKDPPIKSRMLVNPEAFKKLGLKHLYINGLESIDGITNER